MKQTFKKSIGILLTVLLLFSAVAPAGVADVDLLALSADAAEITASGTAGDSVTWTLDSDGLLTVSGVGEIRQGADYSRFSEEIISIVVETESHCLAAVFFPR
ncbi:MAG: hypothetical protein IKM24_05765 [Clostridia bacterium]|nr:hypothetical protein [Clostridia bacterium]